MSSESADLVTLAESLYDDVLSNDYLEWFALKAAM